MNIFLQMHAFSQEMFTMHLIYQKEITNHKNNLSSKGQFLYNKFQSVRSWRKAILFTFSVHSVTCQQNW